MKKEILWFEITMDEVLGPEEFQCGCQLLQEMTNNHLVQSTLWRWREGGGPITFTLDVLREVALGAILHHQVNMCLCFPAVDQGDNMIMANALEDIDFAGQVLQELLGQFGAEYRLDGDWFFRGLVMSLVDCSEGASANLVLDNVVSHLAGFWHTLAMTRHGVRK